MHDEFILNGATAEVTDQLGQLDKAVEVLNGIILGSR